MGRFGGGSRRTLSCQEIHPDDEDARLECETLAKKRRMTAIGFIVFVIAICLISWLLTKKQRPTKLVDVGL